MYKRDVKLSFPNNSIKKIHTLNFTLDVTILTSFQNDSYIYISLLASHIDSHSRIGRFRNAFYYNYDHKCIFLLLFLFVNVNVRIHRKETLRIVRLDVGGYPSNPA